MDKQDLQKIIDEDLRLEKLAYRILQLPYGSDIDEVKKAFRILAKKYHPDKDPKNKELQQNFLNARNAYEFLVSRSKRGKFELGENEKAGIKSDKYNLKNPWGYFLWWKDKFFR